MQIHYRWRDRHLAVAVKHTGPGRYHVAVDGQPRDLDAAAVDGTTLHLVAGETAHTARIARIGDGYHVALDGEVYVFTPELAGLGAGRPGALAPPQILAPMPGKVLQVLVREGQRVDAGDGLLVLEAMKMEHRMIAEAPAVVRRLHIADGQMVDGGAVLVELEYVEPEEPGAA